MLACPVCKGLLEFHEPRGEIWCLRCRLTWPIQDGVPDLVPGSSRPLRQ
ncbi:Trm112 family protein [Hyalangium versicolor]|nr:Trm112 family protein [Hyalangium versicolor]